MDEVEVEKEARVMKCFYHPNASFRTFWDFMQVFLLMYHIQSTLPSALLCRAPTQSCVAAKPCRPLRFADASI